MDILECIKLEGLLACIKIPVEEEVLLKILELLDGHLRANSQPVEYIVVRDSDSREK